jgi:hypothetical protein
VRNMFRLKGSRKPFDLAKARRASGRRAREGGLARRSELITNGRAGAAEVSEGSQGLVKTLSEFPK